MKRALLILMVLSAIAGGAWWWLRHMPRHWWREDIVAEFHDQFVTRADVEDGLRSYLWRRGHDWQTLSPEARAAAQTEVFESLIRQRVLTHHRRQQPAIDAQAAAAREFTSWQKQFQTDEERTQRLAWRSARELQYQKQLREEQADQAWLETQAGERMKLPTDKELRRWFTKNIESFRIPTAHRAAHIYLTRHEKEKPDRKPEIEAIYQQLTSGQTTFAELAAQFSEDDRTKKTGGDLGWFTRDRMPTDFMAAVEALKVGQTSAPFLTQLGWHILKVTDRRPSRLPNFEEVRPEIAATLLSQARAAAVQEIVTGLVQRHEKDLWRCAPDTLASIEPASLANP